MTRFTGLLLVLTAVSTGFADDKMEPTLKSLEQKLHGTWAGKGPCDGSLTLKADGTYMRKSFGPGEINVSGKWSLSWVSLPPTLTLKRDALSHLHQPELANQWRINELDDETLTLALLNAQKRSDRTVEFDRMMILDEKTHGKNNGLDAEASKASF